MTDRTSLPREPSPGARLFYALPVIGWIGRDIAKDIDNVFYALIILLTAVVLAVQAFGLPALVLAALALVPVIFVLLLWVTLP
ncbi:MAG: hypothetical protein HC844_20895 [Tabrizicola sp.]|nr:hypothetical protein [Tabrizicola sp.]